MICELEHKEVEELRPSRILPQTTYWGRIKDEQGFEPISFELKVSQDLLLIKASSEEKQKDDLLVLLRYIDQNHCYAYVPYGPKMEPEEQNQGLFLEELSEVIRSSLPANCMFIRYDLMWKNLWSADEAYFDETGQWIGPPERRIQELRMNFGTQNSNIRKSPGDQLPKNTFFIDLKKSEEEILQNMRFNTRHCIRKAIKLGIEVNEYGAEYLPTWYQLYRTTALRHGLPLNDESFFKSILIHQDTDPSGVKVHMLMAGRGAEFYASMFLVISEKRASYLYGASSDQNKKNHASYLLQWESIKLAKRLGCAEYDMFGSAPNVHPHHPLHGVHIYKKGFGGKLFHRMGCWDYPYDNDGYQLYLLNEMNPL